jgi:hypothetical protein
MPAPLFAPPLLVLYPFRYRETLTRKWVRARYVAQRADIATRYAEWPLTGQPGRIRCILCSREVHCRGTRDESLPYSARLHDPFFLLGKCG